MRSACLARKVSFLDKYVYSNSSKGAIVQYMPTGYLYYSCQLYRPSLRVTAHVKNIFSLSVTIKMALCGSQQRNLMWYMFGILFIVLGICSNHIARTVSIGYTCICSTQIFFCMSEKKNK